MRTLSILTLSVMLAACGSGHAEPGSAKSAVAAQAVGQNATGPARLVANALSTITLRPEQRVELERLLDQASARHKTLRETTGNKLVPALADQLEKGTIDRAALATIVAEARAQHEAAQAADAADLNRLHTLLSPEQRAEFVDAVKTEFRRHQDRDHGGSPGHHKGRGKEPHDGEEDDKHAEDGHAQAHERNHGGMAKHGVWKLFKALNLDDAQKEKVKAVLAEMRRDDPADADKPEHKNVVDSKVQAFEAFKDGAFDANSAMFAHAASARWAMGEHLVEMMEKIVPVLTADQRTQVAARLRNK
jgi:Spy/CpxP family protein refolding chaperone